MDETRSWIEGLYQETGPQLLSFLVQRLGSLGAGQDVLQETFAVALRHADRVRSAASARAYLFGIARNLAANEARRAARETEWTARDAAAEESSPDPRLGLLREAIARLKPEFREALQMRLQHELSYEETAVALGVPVGTVRSRLHYAVYELRRILQREAGDRLARKDEV